MNAHLFCIVDIAVKPLIDIGPDMYAKVSTETRNISDWQMYIITSVLVTCFNIVNAQKS